jgi:hypothetical protein
MIETVVIGKLRKVILGVFWTFALPAQQGKKSYIESFGSNSGDNGIYLKLLY